MKSANSVIKAKSLKKGDTLGIIATGAPLEEARLQKGIKAIEARGFKVEIPQSPSKYYASHGWANGNTEERLEAFNSLLTNPEVKAIVSARGGYGTPQMLPYLELSKHLKNPKPLVGLSDFCVMLSYQTFIANIASIHGTSLGSSMADDTEEAKKDTDELFEMLCNPNYLPTYQCQNLRSGVGKGRILATNLTMLCFLLGTEFEPNLKDAVLVLEDVSEAPFRVHRMLLQLQLAGKFNDLAGLVFGRFSRCEAKNGPQMEEVFDIFIKENANTFPVLKGLEMGHWGRNVPLPNGCLAEISGEVLKILESAVV